MQFFFPEILPLLLIIPLLLVAYILVMRRRQRYALRYASLSLVRDALGRGPHIRRHIPPALFLLGSTILIVAFARPYSVVALPSMEATVILTMDVSGSMRAQDLKPSRIEAAKTAELRRKMDELEEPYRQRFHDSRKKRFPQEYQEMFDLPPQKRTPRQQQLAFMVEKQVRTSDDFAGAD